MISQKLFLHATLRISLLQRNAITTSDAIIATVQDFPILGHRLPICFRNKNPKNSDCETRWLVYSWDKITPQGIVSWKKRLVPLLKRILKQGVSSDQMADGYVVRFPNFLLYSRGTRLGEMVQQCVPWITDVGDSIQRAKMACLTSQDISWIQIHFSQNTKRERMVLYAASCFSPHWALVAFHVSPREQQAPPPPAWLRKRPPTNVGIFMGIHIYSWEFGVK